MSIQLPSVKPWQALPLNAQQARSNLLVLPEYQRPRALLRFADSEILLVSGLLDNGGTLAKYAALVDTRYGKGHRDQSNVACGNDRQLSAGDQCNPQFRFALIGVETDWLSLAYSGDSPTSSKRHRWI